MTVARSAADVLREHVTFELECIDRMYLNAYVPFLQTPQGVAWLLREQLGHRFPSTALLAPITESFVRRIKEFVERDGVPLVDFEKHQRKDDVTQRLLRDFRGPEGVLYVGRAQEKARVPRTERRHDAATGRPYPWIIDSTAMVHHYYFYCVDRDFGPFFLKFCSYFPYNAKLCLNGHEYLKRQLDRRGIAYEPLDNGLLRCADPAAAQQICDEFSAEKIDQLLRKWLAKLPHPFPREYCDAGCRYDLSMLQVEFSLTQVLDQPHSGRVFFEELIRDNLDAGRPDQVQLIFDRRVRRDTPGTFRTRIITEGVVPSLHVYYKNAHLKQYHKQDRALRTEMTSHDTRDFAIGRRLHNLPALRKVGFSANRRLLDVQRISHDVTIGEETFQQLQRPVVRDGVRAAGLRFGDPRVLALLLALLLFRLLPQGFTNRELREHIAPLLGLAPGQLPQGRMTYDLRRLRLHGLIERIPRSQRYHVTDFGLRAAAFLSRAYARLLRPGLALLGGTAPPAPTPIRAALDQLQRAIDRAWTSGRLAA
ncbi:MAG: hypothetical protein EPO65_03930 [Dehalococcoidia bacterium]|nr:MAG: hypothetical protein EPO65_03930 [Dehalococcoidia bacterium]